MQAVDLDNPAGAHRFVAYAAGAVWNGSAFVAWVDANVATYLIAATRIGTTAGYYAADVAGADRWELWQWTGTLSTSGPVYDSPPANVTRVNGEAIVPAAARVVAVTQRNVKVVGN